jgi:hypothetical protein
MADPKAPSTDRERRRMRNRASSMSRVRELDPAAHRDLLRSLEPAADAEKRRRTGGQRTDLEQRRSAGRRASGAQRTDREQRVGRRRAAAFEPGMVGHEEDFGPVIRDRGQSQASAEEHQRAIDRDLSRRAGGDAYGRQAGGDAYGRQSTDRERRLERLRRRSGARVTDEELRRSRRGR